MYYVTKADGKKELFDEEKLRLSIKRSKIPAELENQAVNSIKSNIYEGIPTSKIYKYILGYFGRSDHPYSKAKYGLKQAIIDLGPTGYPFEDFVAEIFKLQGYTTQVRQILQGACISHEVDIVFEKDGKKHMAECKFHNGNGIKTDVHVSLYTKARFDDLKEKNNLSQAWLVTNTKLTQDALSYAVCENMNVISWNYPEGESLRDLVEKFSLHPTTSLTTLSQNQKKELLNNHIVLTKDICRNPKNLDILNLSREKLDEILTESRFVCSL